MFSPICFASYEDADAYKKVTDKITIVQEAKKYDVK